MFTGIVQGLAEITRIEEKPGLHTLQIHFPTGAMENVAVGASVAINGVCLTVVQQESRDTICFDVMMETLSCTGLGKLRHGDRVNFERAARIGDEIGGHILSGHVHTQARVRALEKPTNNHRLTFQVDTAWMKYIFPKGFIAIDGASLTVGETGEDTFTVYLIPETLRVTRFALLEEGDMVNIEVDSQTQAIVDTLARLGYDGSMPPCGKH
ncbi:MAG: riboflavin synthase [Alteromonadaceae bacterium]|nr:riboflavin synthase [Alteromonadaceae bacterium]